MDFSREKPDPDQKVTAGLIRENLIDIFGKEIAEEEFFSQWVEIGVFLADKAAVLDALASLNKAMWAELLVRDGQYNKVPEKSGISGIFDKVSSVFWESESPKVRTKLGFMKYQQTRKSHYGNKYFDESEGRRDKYDSLNSEDKRKFQAEHFGEYYQESDNASKKINGGLLNACLKKAELGFGFNPGRATYHGFFQAKDFMNEVQEKKQWKDPGANPAHGEYTHRLQWYCIGETLFQKITGDVYESIGDSFFKGYSIKSQTKTKLDITLTLWDALCDRTNVKNVSFDTKEFQTFDAPEAGVDFRSPENLNLFLKGQEAQTDDLFFLNFCLSARWYKRLYYALDGRNIDAAEYITRKKFKCSYNAIMEEKEKKDFVDQLVAEQPPKFSWE